MGAPLQRSLNISELLRRRSLFLFGPRLVGKSTLIRQTLPDVPCLDLLDTSVLATYLRRPKLLREVTQGDLVVIDEVQKLPALLDEVHWLIEHRGTRFLLTGSSARKLKRGGANLLGGRAWWATLHPLTYHELSTATPNAFDLLRYLNCGGLPPIYASDDARGDLQAYVGLYLREEIQHEAATRNLAAFAEFLDLLALSNGEEVNYQNLASDCGVAPNTIKSFLQVLEDTLIAFPLPAFAHTKRRKAITRSKLYFFDIGVVNALAKRGTIVYGSELFGKAFEHFLVQEIRAYLAYTRSELPLCYWRSTTQYEVDLILGRQWAIEIKGTTLVHERHARGLRALAEEQLVEQYAIVSCDEAYRRLADGIHVYPWEEFLTKLWAGKIVRPV